MSYFDFIKTVTGTHQLKNHNLYFSVLSIQYQKINLNFENFDVTAFDIQYVE